MKNKKYSIIYSSLTGNTKVLADAIHEALPQDECEYFGVSDTVIPSSELLYIGFWTDKGNADTKTLQLLSQLKNKQIFLFGTAGFGGSDIYFRKILNQVKQFVDASNVIFGEYMCQGRMLTVHCLTLMQMTWRDSDKPLGTHPSDKTIK